MSSKMLQFVTTNKAMPEKRAAGNRVVDSMKFMMNLTLRRPKRNRHAVPNAGCRFVK